MEEKINDYLNSLTEALLYVDAEDSNEINKIEKEYNCSIVVYIEKHNVLQFTYYYEITIPDYKEKYFVEIEDGINRGTLIVSEGFDCNTREKTKIISVLKDIIFDEEEFFNWYKRNNYNVVFVYSSLHTAQNYFNNEKNNILKIYSEQNYDNYFTGGGTIKTDKYYQNKFELFSVNGIFWKEIYEEKEVDRNFV